MVAAVQVLGDYKEGWRLEDGKVPKIFILCYRCL